MECAFESTTNVYLGQWLVWSSLRTDAVCTIDNDRTRIRFLRSGVYLINLKVLYQKCSDDDVCRMELNLDGKPLQSCAFPTATGSGVTSWYSLTVPVVEGQVLTVKKRCHTYVPKASLTLTLVN
uniref:TNF family profile domain-containing protein n=1 Tax=Globisporangium ultimum (strain ATCC 200006 / CBS 805.95 / DAOM BR144) TaxID=431595 RepID=K3X5X1_GLOUD